MHRGLAAPGVPRQSLCALAGRCSASPVGCRELGLSKPPPALQSPTLHCQLSAGTQHHRAPYAGTASQSQTLNSHPVTAKA